MSRLTVEVEHGTERSRSFDTGFDRSVRVTTVTCPRCGHFATVYGDSEASAKRGCIMLRDECPKGQRNFYALPT